MKIDFDKYEGTGNDFIVVDGFRFKDFELNDSLINRLCNRKFGIGADGIIIIKKHDDFDFYLDYYNADGSQSFCGNGSRCGAQFAYHQGIISKKHTKFNAIDGIHEAYIEEDSVKLKMVDVSRFSLEKNQFIIDTGSPHILIESNDLSTENTLRIGKEMRYSERFKKDGINVNLFERKKPNQALISTYERGVENETLSCGTGATACAIALNLLDPTINRAEIHSKGGVLEVSFDYDTNHNIYREVYLKGSVNLVFHGTIQI